MKLLIMQFSPISRHFIVKIIMYNNLCGTREANRREI
jgi:hypothetical protein